MMQQELAKQEARDVRKNYTRTPNILFEEYPDLHPQEKWLFINLIYLCGARGTRHLSIRYISQKTGISMGALSGSKDPTKKNPGMLRNLHTAGLIHAEIKKKKLKDGTESSQAQYHITIVDIWQLNEIHFQNKRSENERSEDESVRNVNTSAEERSENERERSENDTKVRLDNKIRFQDSSSSSDGEKPERKEEEEEAKKVSQEWGTPEAVVALFEELRGYPYDLEVRPSKLADAKRFLAKCYHDRMITREETIRLWNSAMVNCPWKPGGWCTDRPLEISTLAAGENAMRTLTRLDTPPSPRAPINGHTPEPIPTRQPKKIFRAPTSVGAPS